MLWLNNVSEYLVKATVLPSLPLITPLTCDYDFFSKISQIIVRFFGGGPNKLWGIFRLQYEHSLNLGCKELGRHRVFVVCDEDDPPSWNQKRG